MPNAKQVLNWDPEELGKGHDRGRTGQRPFAKTCEVASMRWSSGMDGGNTLSDVQFCTGRTKI